MWVLSWEVGCNGRRMALKLVGADNYNFGIHGNQWSNWSHPITIKPYQVRHCEGSTTVWRWRWRWGGECNGCILGLKIFFFFGAIFLSFSSVYNNRKRFMVRFGQRFIHESEEAARVTRKWGLTSRRERLLQWPNVFLFFCFFFHLLDLTATHTPQILSPNPQSPLTRSTPQLIVWSFLLHNLYSMRMAWFFDHFFKFVGFWISDPHPDSQRTAHLAIIQEKFRARGRDG